MDRNIIILYNMNFTHLPSKYMNLPPELIIGIYFGAVRQGPIKMNLSILRDSSLKIQLQLLPTDLYHPSGRNKTSI